MIYLCYFEDGPYNHHTEIMPRLGPGTDYPPFRYRGKWIDRKNLDLSDIELPAPATVAYRHLSECARGYGFVVPKWDVTITDITVDGEYHSIGLRLEAETPLLPFVRDHGWLVFEE